MRKFEDSIPLQLLKAREATMEFFRPFLQENNITEQQWRVLRALNAYGELESKQLAQHCCILSPSLTGIIKRLEQQDYVRKRKSEEDQRRTLINLTPKSLRLFEQLSPVVDARYQEFIRQFGAEKLESLSALLNDLVKLKP